MSDSELTAEQIKQAKREKLLQNLERGRKVRADNLKMARQRNLKKTIESNETENSEETLEENKSNKKEPKTPPTAITNFACVCGKNYKSKYALKRHEGICKIYQGETSELDEAQDQKEVDDKKNIEVKIVDDKEEESDDDEVEIQVIKRKKPKKPKKKKVVYVDDDESDEEAAPKNIIIKKTEPPPTPPPSPPPPPPPLKKNLVPSAHNKHTNVPKNHFENEEKYTLAQFKSIIEKENRMKQEKAIADKRLKEDKRLKSIIENMRMGGI